MSKLEDRVQNAHNTLIVDDMSIYENILLIDDAVGSGATFNEVAKAIREKHLVAAGGHVIGLAITGSLKGFDIISEV